MLEHLDCRMFCSARMVCTEIFLTEAVGILSLPNYSWTVGLQIVSLGTHGLHYLFPFVGNFLVEAVGILSLSSYSWTLELDCFL